MEAMAHKSSPHTERSRQRARNAAWIKATYCLHAADTPGARDFVTSFASNSTNRPGPPQITGMGCRRRHHGVGRHHAVSPFARRRRARGDTLRGTRPPG